MEPEKLFTEAEIAYLRGQRIARIATSHSGSDQPDVAAVGFEFDEGQLHVGGLNLRKTLKYRNVRDNPLVAIVIDDLESVDPWRPRGIKIHGRATTVVRDEREFITITPVKKWSWGINQEAFRDGKLLLDRDIVET